MMMVASWLSSLTAMTVTFTYEIAIFQGMCGDARYTTHVLNGNLTPVAMLFVNRTRFIRCGMLSYTPSPRKVYYRSYGVCQQPCKRSGDWLMGNYFYEQVLSVWINFKEIMFTLLIRAHINCNVSLVPL